MAKHTFKILRCEHRKILKVCFAIFQHYECKVKPSKNMHKEPLKGTKIMQEICAD